MFYIEGIGVVLSHDEVAHLTEAAQSDDRAHRLLVLAREHGIPFQISESDDHASIAQRAVDLVREHEDLT